ncbi:MFS transporter [Tessaracoccus palaemonis]|uniref:MFS transporter n=1 Tax=Tessaracoccus palaemonis TaxID=2829499 RepID=A0ABX8SFM1_9ACTN|nr:MFS transporter [Tessaracoccus palaemonis]QXT62075.1 MFS transporter [Tessaracoccus palaemonis]
MVKVEGAQARQSRRGSHLMVGLLAAAVATFGELYAVQGVLTGLARDFRLSSADSALAVSAGTTGLACGVFGWTLVAERIGRLQAMRVSVFGAALLGILSCLAPSFALLVGLRFTTGALLGGVPVLAVAYVYEILDGARAAAAATAYISGTTLGGASGRLIAGPLAGPLGWRGALLVVSALCLLAAVAFVALTPRPDGRPAPAGRQWPRIGDCLRSRALRPLYLQALVLTGCFVAVYNFLAFRLEAPPYGLPSALTSLIFVTYLSGTASSRLAGSWLTRHGARRTMVVGLLTMVVGVALLAATPLPVLIAGLIIFTAGFFLAHAAAVATTGAVSDPMHRGQASALYNVHFYVGSGVGGWLLGYAFVLGGWGTMSAAIVVALLALAAGHMMSGRDRPVG